MKGCNFWWWHLISILETFPLLYLCLPELNCGLSIMSTLSSLKLLLSFRETPCNCQQLFCNPKKTIPRNDDYKEEKK